MKELVIISGKGGTGKTSVVAAFAALSGNQAVFADCDVDAADLHLILSPRIRVRHPFISGHEAIIRQADCSGCGLCVDLCRFGAAHQNADGAFRIDPIACEGCGVCVHFCPESAIDFPEAHCGEWYISDTRFGPLIHARLNVAAENSGKLVSTVRKAAREKAEETGRELIIADGSPGIGCPVIASLSGALMALAVTEPTPSGLHDVERALGLTRHFKIPTALCVNKWDLNPEKTAAIEALARSAGAVVAGRIGYDRAVTKAQTLGLSVVENGFDNGGGPAPADIRALWKTVASIMEEIPEATLQEPAGLNHPAA